MASKWTTCGPTSKARNRQDTAEGRLTGRPLGDPGADTVFRARASGSFPSFLRGRLAPRADPPLTGGCPVQDQHVIFGNPAKRRSDRLVVPLARCPMNANPRILSPIDSLRGPATFACSVTDIDMMITRIGGTVISSHAGSEEDRVLQVKSQGPQSAVTAEKRTLSHYLSEGQDSAYTFACTTVAPSWC